MNDNLLKRNLDYLGLPYLREEIHNLLEEAAQKRTPLGDFLNRLSLLKLPADVKGRLNAGSVMPIFPTGSL